MLAKHKETGETYTVQEGLQWRRRQGIAQEALVVRKPDLPVASDWSLQIINYQIRIESGKIHTE